MPTSEVSKTVEFLTQDPRMLGLLDLVAKVAPSDVPVLIQGESGTGKEVLAKRLHQLSSRSKKTCVSINCGALQDNLLLSELFGHEKGAFTGAMYQKVGLAEVADGGTLFLDEIGEMGLEAQAKLLRFLQEGEIYRVGGRSPIRVDCRILSATNKNLDAQVKAGEFREDLYYRVNTVSLRVSPLRERPADVPLLIEHFLKRPDKKIQSPVARVSPQTMAFFSKYNWPGNVRELQNICERLRILGETEEVGMEELPAHMTQNRYEEDFSAEPSTFLLDEIERRHILRVLNHFEGNKTQAANSMGITVKTLYNKLARYKDEGSLSPGPNL